MTGEIFHIFMVCVDDFCELATVHRLLKHPHVHCGVKLVILGCIGSHNLGNGRAPVDMVTQEIILLPQIWLDECTGCKKLFSVFFCEMQTTNVNKFLCSQSD